MSLLGSAGLSKKENIKNWLDKKINNTMNNEYIRKFEYSINEDLSVNINGSIHILNNDIIQESLPNFIEFNEISNYFHCSYVGLTSMKGFPKIIYESFDAAGNELSSFENIPKYVKKNASLSSNNIKTFDYISNIDFIGFLNIAHNNFDKNADFTELLKLQPGQLTGLAIHGNRIDEKIISELAKKLRLIPVIENKLNTIDKFAITNLKVQPRRGDKDLGFLLY